MRRADWRLCECTGWPENDSDRRVVAWCWSGTESRHLVAVNLSDAPATARVRLPWGDLAGRGWTLSDRPDGRRFERAGDELAGHGLYVALDPWAFPLPRLRGALTLRANRHAREASTPARRLLQRECLLTRSLSTGARREHDPAADATAILSATHRRAPT